MTPPVADRSVETVAETVRALVDRYRRRCLWFLRTDYYPATRTDVLRVLGYLERYGDREGFGRAASIRQWLSPTSSGTSVDS